MNQNENFILRSQYNWLLFWLLYREMNSQFRVISKNWKKLLETIFVLYEKNPTKFSCKMIPNITFSLFEYKFFWKMAQSIHFWMKKIYNLKYKIFQSVLQFWNVPLSIYRWFCDRLRVYLYENFQHIVTFCAQSKSYYYIIFKCIWSECIQILHPNLLNPFKLLTISTLILDIKVTKNG